jgi:hypothetical protein
MPKPKDEELERNAATAAEFMRAWAGPGHVHPHTVAHRDPDTLRLTYVVRCLPLQFIHIWTALADPAGVMSSEEEAARRFTAEWDGPAHDDLPQAHVDRERDPLTYVIRFAPEQFLYMKAMVEL